MKRIIKKYFEKFLKWLGYGPLKAPIVIEVEKPTKTKEEEFIEVLKSPKMKEQMGFVVQKEKDAEVITEADQHLIDSAKKRNMFMDIYNRVKGFNEPTPELKEHIEFSTYNAKKTLSTIEHTLKHYDKLKESKKNVVKKVKFVTPEDWVKVEEPIKPEVEPFNNSSEFLERVEKETVLNEAVQKEFLARTEMSNFKEDFTNSLKLGGKDK